MVRLRLGMQLSDSTCLASKCKIMSLIRGTKEQQNNNHKNRYFGLGGAWALDDTDELLP